MRTLLAHPDFLFLRHCWLWSNSNDGIDREGMERRREREGENGRETDRQPQASAHPRSPHRIRTTPSPSLSVKKRESVYVSASELVEEACVKVLSLYRIPMFEKRKENRIRVNCEVKKKKLWGTVAVSTVSTVCLYPTVWLYSEFSNLSKLWRLCSANFQRF